MYVLYPFTNAANAAKYFKTNNVICSQVGLNFMVYESVRTYLTYEGEQNPGAGRKLLAGAISGAVAQTFTYPLYVVHSFFYPPSCSLPSTLR